MSIAIREAAEADLPAVAELFDLYRQFYEQPADRGLALRFVTQRLARGESTILVAQQAEAGLVGFCQLYPSFCSIEAAPVCILYDLYVRPAARRTGAARLLLAAAEAHAAATGAVRLELTTARTNLPAQTLYAARGWVRDEVYWAYHKRPTPG
ncbi:GNAT family N-acetyltransferase [Pseudorhodoferax sp.]|uniref:GNAT family N-acetyltransferase n=1 Tax=Pseudorhodoferax sp. TaxID=1993553 RepID=UPI002DD6A461|nr:GNAT family N-acetyltransferase [Pseudorhodoferax sp.]